MSQPSEFCECVYMRACVWQEALDSLLWEFYGKQFGWLALFPSQRDIQVSTRWGGPGAEFQAQTHSSWRSEFVPDPTRLAPSSFCFQLNGVFGNENGGAQVIWRLDSTGESKVTWPPPLRRTDVARESLPLSWQYRSPVISQLLLKQRRWVPKRRSWWGHF